MFIHGCLIIILNYNYDKTEVLLIGRKEQRTKIRLPSLVIGNSNVCASNKARNIGIMFDENMNMDMHITTVCRSAYMHLRNIGMIRKYLNQKATESLVHAFVSSRLDNGNALLVGLPNKKITKLQLIQNTAARIVVRNKFFLAKRKTDVY